MERKWGKRQSEGVAWKAAAIHDKDGSVGGVPTPTFSSTTAQRQHRNRRNGL